MNIEFETEEQRQEFLSRVDTAIEKIEEKIRQIVDKEFLINQYGDVAKKLKAKKDNGEKLTLRDLQELLKVARNVYVPAAISQQVDRLRAMKKMATVNG